MVVLSVLGGIIPYVLELCMYHSLYIVDGILETTVVAPFKKKFFHIFQQQAIVILLWLTMTFLFATYEIRMQTIPQSYMWKLFHGQACMQRAKSLTTYSWKYMSGSNLHKKISRLLLIEKLLCNISSISTGSFYKFYTSMRLKLFSQHCNSGLLLL